MLVFETALDLLLEQASPLDAERIPLEEAFDRVLASDLKALRSSPLVPVSAMDGYAVLDRDLGATLPVAGESFAGSPAPPMLTAGTCLRVFTGAPVPPNAERVVVQEMVDRRPEGVVMPATRPRGAHIRRAGSDFAQGETLLERGATLSPQALVAVAAADLEAVEVIRRPRVAILATGDELRAPGASGDAQSIPDSVTYGVMGLTARYGGQVCMRSRLPDRPDVLRRAAMEAMATSDVVVVTGGASVGERDFAKSMFDGLGLEILFSKVAIKPGKPVWLGRAGRALVVGLPGNPTSAMVTARLFLAPLIAGLAGRDPRKALEWRAAVLDGETPDRGDRDIFLRARRLSGRLQLAANQESGAQKTLGQAEALVWLPREGTWRGVRSLDL
ncbi:MAG: molybdopterin molybdotransferase MoeA [Bordetella sp.]|nr:molybdopterin molybdotransferase MoeA [Bordetella sp.]